MNSNPTAAAGSLQEALKGNFVIANLGAALDKDYPLPPDIRKSVTLVELDAGDRPIGTASDVYHRKVTVRSAVAGGKGKRTFTIAAHLGNCSLLKVDHKVTNYFGVDDLWREVSTKEFETTTFPEVLAANGIKQVDFLKTDLEGVDFEVIKSCEALLPNTLAVQPELRFRPFYFDETPADEVITFLAKRGFDMLGLNPFYWKPNSKNRDAQMDGSLAYVDCIFVRRADTLSPEALPLGVAKLIILCSLLEKRCHGAWLLDTYGSRLPQAWVGELKRFTEPASFTAKFKAAMMDAIKATSFGRRYLARKYGMSFDHYSPTVFNCHNV